MMLFWNNYSTTVFFSFNIKQNVSIQFNQSFDRSFDQSTKRQKPLTNPQNQLALSYRTQLWLLLHLMDENFE